MQCGVYGTVARMHGRACDMMMAAAAYCGLMV